MAEETTSSGQAAFTEARPAAVPARNGLLNASVAVCANNPSAVPHVLRELSAFGASPSVENDDVRLGILHRARTLVAALETPREMMINDSWVQPGLHAAITACYNAGVFKVLAEKDGPMNVSEITRELGLPCKADDTFGRMMKHVAAMGRITETGADEYAPTKFSTALTIPAIGDGYPALAGGAHPSCSKFAEYLLKNDYTLTSDIQAGPFQYAFSTRFSMFEYLNQHPPLGEQFDHHMSGYRQGRPSWMDHGFYPVQKNLVEGLDTSDDAVLLVDVGGGHGHDIQEFRTKHPNAPGRLVLQDLPSVIDRIDQLDVSIERMKHDFYAEQPLKGARAYYMHSVLHDWPNDVCVSILKQIVSAMARGYSKLLINENVIPDRSADREATGLDMMMMTLFSSKERRLGEWKELLEASGLGLKILHVWSVKHSQESLIECELA